MTQQVQQPQGRTSHFDAAKVIVETLQGLDKTSQALAMRFAAETLGLHMETPAAPVMQPLAASPQGSGGATHSTDIKQFTAAKAPKSDQQFAAIAAILLPFRSTRGTTKGHNRR